MYKFIGFDPYNPQESDLHVHYAVILARFEGKWIFVQHKERSTFECPGGHREPNEPILTTAHRELYEETGAKKFDLEPLEIYKVRREDSDLLTYGLLCYAHVYELGPLPESEIGCVHLADSCLFPMTYPTIQPHLFQRVIEKTCRSNFCVLEKPQ